MADRWTLPAWWFSPLMLLLFTPAHTPGSAQQQQPTPSNDNCASATPVAFGVAIIANPTLATFDASLDKLCNQFGTIPGVWFTFRGTGERVTVMQISDEAEVTLHQGTTCGASTLTCASSLYMRSFTPTFTVQTDASATYYLLVKNNPDKNFVFTLIKVPSTVTENDVCSKANPMSIEATVTTNFTFATPDIREVVDDCVAGSRESETLKQSGLWYSFQGTDGRVTISANRNFWYMSVYKGACGPATLSCVAGDNFVASLTLSTDSSTTYYVLVRRNEFNLDPVDLSLFQAPTVPNDVCSKASPVSLGVRFRGNLTFATLDDVDAPRCGARGNRGRGVWFAFTGTGGRISAVNTCDGGPDYLYVSVYKGTCGTSTLQCHADFASSCNNRAPSTFNTEAGTTYHVLVQSLDPSGPYNYDMMLVSASPNIDDNDVCPKSKCVAIG
jgi:hypothetical protein